MKIEIDLKEFAEQVKNGKSVTSKGGVLNDLLKQLTEMTLQAELDSHLAQDLERNRKNGYSQKTMRTEHGEFELNTPRDRNGSFEPQIVKKNQTHMSDEIEKKMLSLFSLGSSQSQIIDHIQEIYGVSFSKPAITAVTDKLIPMMEEWKKRPLEPIYPFLYLDAIHYKVRENGSYISKAFYTVLGVNLEGKKEILGLYLNESEGSKFWLQVLTDLQNRGFKIYLLLQLMD